METKDILKSLRKSKGFSTMQDFCAAADISFSTYQNYETGKRIPTAEILIKLADFYGVSTDYLLGRNTGESTPLDELAGQFNMSLLEKKIVENYLKLPENMRGDLMEFLAKSVQEVQEESKAEAPAGKRVFKIASSTDNHPGEVRTLTPEEEERIKNAPDVTSEDTDL